MKNKNTNNKSILKSLIIINAIFLIINICLYFILRQYNNKHLTRSYCQSSTNCEKCTNGKKKCYYYNDDMTISNESIICDCEMEIE